MRVYKRMCYLCFTGKGGLKPAVGYYVLDSGEQVDVCIDCAKLCESHDKDVFYFQDEDNGIVQEDSSLRGM